jgi:hypothetical protein
MTTKRQPDGHDLTDAQIIELATWRQFAVHRHRYNTESLRRRCRRLVRANKLRLADKNGSEFYYEAVKP